MSKIEVNQISSQCGSTLTIGQSGDTIQLACGATQTGFGRTGTVDWDTTAKTASFTAVSGNGYFVNTTSAAVTMTLPATPSAGDIVSVKDYAYTFATNNFTVNRNGSPIGGGTDVNTITYSTNGDFLTFIYVDGTRGWVLTNDSTNIDNTGAKYVTATGGTVTCCGDYKIHTFTSPGTFCVSCAGNAGGSTTVDYLVVAGGGGGGTNDGGGGGGAGGYRESSGAASGCYTASPLGACVSALPVTVQGYPITVGAGGAPKTCSANGPGGNGSNSIFSTITSTGGGGGAQFNLPIPSGGGPKSGGSGGGGGGRAGDVGTCGGAGNTPPVSPPQGNPGGNATPGTTPGSIDAGGGGGGATAAGANGAPNGPGGVGGAGATSSINGTPTARAGGGGGGAESGPGGAGGTGGGGAGSGPGPAAATSATVNTGGGGGGVSTGANASGAGGSGIVIIRYKYQ